MSALFMWKNVKKEEKKRTHSPETDGQNQECKHFDGGGNRRQQTEVSEFPQDKKKLAKLTQFKSDIAWVKAEFQDDSKKQRVDESSKMTETDSDLDIGSQFVSAETNAKTLESDKEGSIDPDKTCVCEPESDINSDKESSIEPESDIDSDKESSIEPEVTTRASCFLRDRHFDNQLKLPHPKDIEMVATKLSSTLADYDYQDMTQYVKIAKTVLLRLMVYNRRRSGEIEELQMKTYLNRKTEVEDVEKSPLGELSTTEQYLIKSQELMWIRGERGKGVPVLIPSDAIKALSYILDPEVRKLAGLKATNKYMFATKGDGVISASESLKELGSGMELIYPDRLSSTGYRAYMATIAQCLGLKDHQIQWLCTHLGHTEDVHKTHYRFALDGIERIQLGKLLLLQDRNLLSKYKNTKLEDIEFEDIVSSTPDEVAGNGEGASRTEAVCGDDNDGGEFGPDSFEIGDVADVDSHVYSPKKKVKKSAAPRVRWTEKELEEINRYGENYLKRKKTPSRTVCLTFIQRSREAGGELHRRSPDLIVKKISALNMKARKTGLE